MVPCVRTLRSTWSVSCAGDPLPDTDSHNGNAERLVRPLRACLARGGAQECEGALVNEKDKSARPNGPDRRLVCEEPPEILTGVNVARAGNETPEHEGAVRIPIRSHSSGRCRVQRGSSGVLRAQRKPQQ